MRYRKISTGMIESTYEDYKSTCANNSEELYDWLNDLDIPVWSDSDDNFKRAAIEYVYMNRNTIELNSSCVASWVQATAYFMIMKFASNISMNEEPEIEIFFDDMDFMMDEDVLNDSDVQEQMGIAKDFTDPF
jgi:hypothetical protein